MPSSPEDIAPAIHPIDPMHPSDPTAPPEIPPPAASATSNLQSPAEQRRPKFFPWFTYLLLMPLFAMATAVFGSVSLLASIFDGSGRIQHAIAHAWGGMVLRIVLSPVRVIGAENFQPGQAAVYVANHLSYMDTPVVLNKLPFQFRILARHDLFRIPFIGWYLQRSGQIPVDSTSLRSTLASLNRGVKVLETGMPLVIFPEGGRSPDGHMQPFLSGPAYMAIRAQVPVVPMALVGTREVMPMHTYHMQPRPLLLIVGAPISTAGYTSKMADELTGRIRDTIAAMYLQHSDSAPRAAVVP